MSLENAQKILKINSDVYVKAVADVPENIIRYDFRNNRRMSKEASNLPIGVVSKNLNLSEIVDSLTEESDFEDSFSNEVLGLFYESGNISTASRQIPYIDFNQNLRFFETEPETYYSYLKKDGFFFLPDNNFNGISYMDSGDKVILYSDSMEKEDFFNSVKEFMDAYNLSASMIGSSVSLIDLCEAGKKSEILKSVSGTSGNSDSERYVVSHSELFDYLNLGESITSNRSFEKAI